MWVSHLKNFQIDNFCNFDIIIFVMKKVNIVVNGRFEMKKLLFILALIASPIFSNVDQTSASAQDSCEAEKFTAAAVLEHLQEHHEQDKKQVSRLQTTLAKFYAKNRKTLDFSFSAFVGMVDALVMTYGLKVADMPALSGMGKYASMIPAGLLGWGASYIVFDKTHSALFAFKARNNIREEHSCCNGHPSYQNVFGFEAGFAGALLFMIGKSIKDTYFA